MSEPAPRHGLSGAVLDADMLDQLRELDSEDDPGFFARVLNLYLTESPKLMAQLQSAVDSADAAQIALVAHSLKSSSANIGASVMGVLCAEMVAAGRGGKVLHAREIFANVAPEHARVQSALQAELARGA